MGRKAWMAVLALLAGTISFAAACAPAGQPRPAAPGVEQPSTQKPAPQQPQQAPVQQPAVQVQAKPKTSVSGIPLDPAAKPGGTLHVAVTGFGPSFSPWEERSGGTDAVVQPVSNLIVQNQTWGTPEDTAKASWFTIQPDLATSWEQSPDGLKWTFKFRDGVKWSDGTPFTCADAKWSLDSIRTGQGLKRSPAATHFLAVDKIQCADDRTMVIDMKRPKAGLLTMIGLPFNPVRPKHIYENATDAMRQKPPQVGTGPFAMVDFIPGEKMTFKRRADYWDQPFPYLDGIEVLILSNQAMDSGLRSGRLDFGPFQGYSGPRLKTMREGCRDCVFYNTTINPSFADTVMVHHQRPPWNNPQIKDAIGYALDRAKFNQLVYLGDNILPRGGPFVPGSGWEMPYDRVKQVPGYNFEDPEGNKVKARELLAKAGYKPNELKVQVSVWAVIQTSAPPIIEDLRAVGIDAEAKMLETALAYDTWSNGGFDIGVHNFWWVTADPDEVLYEHFYSGSDRNYNRYSNPEVDRLIDEMSVTTDLELRKQRAWDVAEVILKEQGKVILGSGTYVPVHGPRVKGWAPASGWLAISGPGVRWQHVWLEEK